MKPTGIKELDDYWSFLEEQDVRQSSRRKYYQTIKKYLVEGNDPGEIDQYNEFIFENSVKKTNEYYYYAIRNFIKFYVKDELLQNQLLKKLQKPKKHAQKTYRRKLDKQTRQQVIDNIKEDKHKLMALVQENTGIRAGDILRIKRSNVNYESDEDSVVLRIDLELKGGKRAVKFIYSPEIQAKFDEFVERYLLDFEYIFLDRRFSDSDADSQTIQFTNYQRYYRDLKNALMKTGVNYKDWATHDFRRSFADMVWSTKKDLLLLQRAMDHADPSTTTRYLAQSGLTTKDLMRELDEKELENE